MVRKGKHRSVEMFEDRLERGKQRFGMGKGRNIDRHIDSI
jgi:hypothetical protein